MLNNQRWLLLGGSGMLGRACRNLLDREGIEYVAPSSAKFDLRQPHTFVPYLTREVGLVVNCAAYTNVDAAETEEAEAVAINAVGVGALAERCAKVGSTLVHYSTDYVFDGEALSPYATQEARRPVNAYGRGKALGERLIEQSGCDHLIIRTSWLYASWGNNFVRTIARLAAERPTLKVVNDQWGRPTSVEHLAEASWKLLNTDARKIYHVADDSACTWHEFAREIVSLTEAACEVLPCSTAEYPRPAKRPRYSVLDLSRTVQRIGALNPWRENLRTTLPLLETTS